MVSHYFTYTKQIGTNCHPFHHITELFNITKSMAFVTTHSLTANKQTSHCRQKKVALLLG